MFNLVKGAFGVRAATPQKDRCFPAPFLCAPQATGWTVPVLVGSDGEEIAGHGCILAPEHLGLTDMIEDPWDCDEVRQQSRRMPLVEAVANVVVGSAVAVATL